MQPWCRRMTDRRWNRTLFIVRHRSDFTAEIVLKIQCRNVHCDQRLKDNWLELNLTQTSQTHQSEAARTSAITWSERDRLLSSGRQRISTGLVSRPISFSGPVDFESLQIPGTQPNCKIVIACRAGKHQVVPTLWAVTSCNDIACELSKLLWYKSAGRGLVVVSRSQYYNTSEKIARSNWDFSSSAEQILSEWTQQRHYWTFQTMTR